jgi:hypothetical protein
VSGRPASRCGNQQGRQEEREGSEAHRWLSMRATCQHSSAGV